MTALADAPAAHQTGRRILATMRVHAANPWTIIFTPWIVLFTILALNLLIWLSIVLAAGDNVDDDAFVANGGIAYLFVYMIVVAAQAMNQTFSFVVGMGTTRRDYFLGTAAIFVALSLQFGVGIAILAGIERATGGWGAGGQFFAPAFLADLPLWEIAVIYTMILLLMFFLGSAVAVVYLRWGPPALVMFFAALGLSLAGTAVLLSLNGAWPTVGRFFTQHSVLELSLYTLPVTVACAIVAWLLMRRSTPKG